MTIEPNRRTILTGASCAALLGNAAIAAPAKADREVVHEFAYGDVTLTGGAIGEQYNWMKAHYLALDNDRVLKVFREHAGLPAPGRNMGGWYDADGFVPGLTFGQYISGLARFGRATGDEACHAKVRYLVEEFGKCLDRNANPYVGPGTEKQWAAYVYDKYNVGLIDAYRLSNVQSAPALLPRVWEGAKSFISPVSRARIGKAEPPYDETYVLSENLFAAAEVTGDRKFRALAEHYLLNKEYYDPLSRGEDVLPAKHAYSYAISLSSGAAAYLALGNPKYKKALVNAWDFMELQRYASGGWGPEEQFVTPHQGKLYDSLFSTKAHFETPCGAYANSKLARYLMRFTGESRYGDGLERDLYNTILAVRRPDNDGDYPYYSTYSASAVKAYYQKKWPCCSGTLAQTVADYPLNVYFHSKNALYVNLYTPSEVRWTYMSQTVRLVQETAFPDADTVKLSLALARPAKFALKLRIPAWIASTPSIKVNGQALAASAKPGFLAVERLWQNGDRVELVLPQNQRLVAIDDKHQDTVALMKGPVMHVSVDPGVAQKAMAVTGAFRPIGHPGDVLRAKAEAFVPYYTVNTETYDTYFVAA